MEKARRAGKIFPQILFLQRFSKHKIENCLTLLKIIQKLRDKSWNNGIMK